MANIIVVRWLDKDEKPHEKQYEDELTARKTRDWLIANGAIGADIAIKVINTSQENTSVIN